MSKTKIVNFLPVKYYRAGDPSSNYRKSGTQSSSSRAAQLQGSHSLEYNFKFWQIFSKKGFLNKHELHQLLMLLQHP